VSRRIAQIPRADPQLAQFQLQVRDLPIVRSLVQPVDDGDLVREQLPRHRFVRRNHAALNELMRFVVRRGVNPDHPPRGVQLDLHLLRRHLKQLTRQRERLLQHRSRARVKPSLWRRLASLQQRESFLVGEPLRRANPALCHLHAHHAPLRIVGEEDREG